MKKNIIVLALIVTSTILFAQNNKTVYHRIFVQVYPETSEIAVVDTIDLKQVSKKEFLLNSKLEATSLSANIKLKKADENAKAGDVGMDRNAEESNIKLTKWIIFGTGDELILSYKGNINAKMQQTKEDYQRGFSQTSGIILDKGTYLGGSTYWVPVFEDRLMTFNLTTELPKDWKNVSQGKRTLDKIENEKHIDTWYCNTPQEEVFLIAAKFIEYSYDMNSGIKAMAFLRTDDEGLANKYLEVTEQYMEMYQSMLGDYPYSKFALVENFWETGYGMPSFTLLGEKIIRFPFILHSSYPHELLHNWWGNSVYVDFETGNWCEGTTVFMADHLIKEQRGAGTEYRRSTLQKYSNYVTKENDFPLSKFHSRSDGPSEAIGYGKAMMMWQMLRRKLGDETFLKGMKLFYKNYKYKTASYYDIQKSMEEVSGIDLSGFFNQWVKRTGAPEIEIKNIVSDMYAGKYRINIVIEQKQSDDVFDIDLPINVVTEKGIESFAFKMDKKEQEFQIALNSKPLKLVVDAQYDVFRILNPNEVPPTLSKIWGSKDNMIILPSLATKEHSPIYLKFAADWKKADNDNFEIVFDKDIKKLPKDKTVWIIGYENKFRYDIKDQLADYNSNLDGDSITLDGKKYPKKGNDYVITLFDKDDINKQRIFVSLENEKAIAGLIRKLPHYGKYSYLGFDGDEPTNIAKGQWAILKSPLVKVFDEKSAKLSAKENREALASLKPVFSEKRIMNSVKYLASEELKGRGLGTPEIDEAAEYIANEFKSAGLQTIKNTYYQEFTHKFADKGEMKLKNVIGIIEGTDPKLKDEVVVVSAHYDHLGLGWPDVRTGNEGKIHYGADDNASGVAIMIELARTMAKSSKPKRTIVFLATTAEEAGLIGSRYFVEHIKDNFSGVFADVNLDTDGSLFDKKLLVLNANSAKEWKFIFMGTDYTTGIKSEVVAKELDASDQVAFIEKGIPAVQLFTGATENYHRPSDTFDKIDGKGMVKVATVTKEVLLYLADREDAMNYTGSTPNSNTVTQAPKSSRKVSTGSVPDFAYTGKGVKIGAVVPNSAGEKAGLKVGDIITAVDGKTLDDLKQYSDMLKQYQVGDTITLSILREDKEQKVKLILGER
jgi:hypothetical protein